MMASTVRCLQAQENKQIFCVAIFAYHRKDAASN